VQTINLKVKCLNEQRGSKPRVSLLITCNLTCSMQLTLPKSALRSFQTADASSLTKYAGAYSIARYHLMPHPYLLQHAEAWIAFATSQQPETNLAISLEDEVVGAIGLCLDSPECKGVFRYSAELDYWLGEPFWGRGIMTEAVVAFVDWAFARLDLVRIHARVYARNAASLRVLAKAGFEFEGRLRACYFKEDEFLDGLLYAKVRAPNFMACEAAAHEQT
jgi:ribosomal-protein-alanine N-acetyltransferase